MPIVPTTGPSVDSAAVPPQYAQANDYTATRLNRQAFDQVEGAGKDIQQASTDVSDIALAQAVQANEAATKDLDTKYSSTLRTIGFGDGTPQNPGLFSQEGQNAVNATPQALAAANAAKAALAAKAPNARVAQLFNEKADIRLGDFQQTAASHVATQRQDMMDQASVSRVAEAQQNASAYWNNPKILAQQMGIAIGEVASLGERKGWDADTVAAKTLNAKSEILKGAINGALSAGSISTAQSILTANKNSIDGDTQLAIATDIKQAENAQRIQQEHAIVMADHAKRQMQDQNYGQVAADVLQNKGDANAIATMMRNGQLDPSQGLTLGRMVLQADKPDPLSHVSAQTSQDLFKGITAPDGDPSKITTRQPIDNAFSNGQLSRPDHDWLVTQLNNGQTPDGAKLNKAQGDFLKLQELSIIHPGAKGSGSAIEIADQAAVNEYNQWVTKQVTAAKTAGKDPYTLFDATPGNKDYLGTPGKIAVFKRAYHLDMNQDFAAFGADPNAPAPAPKPGLLSSIGGVVSGIASAITFGHTDIPGAIFGKNNELTGFESLGDLSKAVATGAVKRDWAETYARSKAWIK